jgi:hypothetical protein
VARPGNGKVLANVSYWKHLRPFAKRKVNKANRKAGKAIALNQ